MTFVNGLFCVAQKKVLITGGSRGIGLMIAEGYAKAGAQVVIASRSEEGLIKACNQINEALPADAKHKVTHFPVDVSNRTSCTELIQKVSELYGMLDVYIYYFIFLYLWLYFSFVLQVLYAFMYQPPPLNPKPLTPKPYTSNPNPNPI